MLESHANISILLSGVGLRKWTSAAMCMRAKQTEHNNSESNMHFMIAVTLEELIYWSVLEELIYWSV